MKRSRNPLIRRSVRSKCLIALASAVATVAIAASTPPDRWWAPGEGRTFQEKLSYPNADGDLELILTGGKLETKGHAFFEPVGPNGRACVTCHQPADAMGLSLNSIQNQWERTGGKDPLFAAYDGSNCPIMPQGERASHSLLLNHGLIRIERPWPPKDWSNRPVKPDFKIDTVRDPNGCNSGIYGAAKGKISVYRRPRPVANMKYLLAIGFPYDPKLGKPMDLDPESGKPVSGNLLADNRAPTLSAQMQDAAITHLGMLKGLSADQRKQIADFELRIYAAQGSSKIAGRLDADGAAGGAKLLADSLPGQLGSIGRAVWSEYQAWETDKPGLPPDQLAFRQSVARGAKVFREKMFLITDSTGINSPVGFGNPVRNSCVFCHNMSQMGNDVAPGQVDLGTTVLPYADPAPHLPLFRITCLGKPHPHYGKSFQTTDPGFALTTGRCADVGKITLQSNRGLASRAPYFSNGLAKDLRGVVDYYERRYAIGYTEQEKRDLVNLMSAL